jgi:hypothetical protein
VILKQVLEVLRCECAGKVFPDVLPHPVKKIKKWCSSIRHAFSSSLVAYAKRYNPCKTRLLAHFLDLRAIFIGGVCGTTQSRQNRKSTGPENHILPGFRKIHFDENRDGGFS